MKILYWYLSTEESGSKNCEDKRKMAETSKTDLMDTVKARYVQIIQDYKIGVDVEQVDVVVPPLHGTYFNSL